MPAPLTNHLHKRVPKDYADVSSAEMHLSDTCIKPDKLHLARGPEPEQRSLGTKVSEQRTAEASPQQCVASLRTSLLAARLVLLEYSSRLVKSYSKEHGQRLQGHTQMVRVMRLEQQLDYLERLQGAAKHSAQGSLSRQPDDGIFEVCEQALENALYLLEHVPKPSYMVDLNEVVWQGLTGMVATGCVETGITMTLPIILGNPQILTWLMTELLVGSALDCLDAAVTCKCDAKPLLMVDCLDTATNWRLNVSMSNAMCTPVETPDAYTRSVLGYVKHAIGLLEGDFWVEASSAEEKTFSLTLPKRLSFA